MQVLKPKEPVEHEFLFFDYECIQETGKHEPNLVVVQSEDGEQWCFEWLSANEDFCSWLFDDEHGLTTLMAHNFGKYDGSFVLRWLLSEGIRCEPLMNGGKIISLRVGKILFMDSLNFLPMALSRSPSTFGRAELKKGYFPHSLTPVRTRTM